MAAKQTKIGPLDLGGGVGGSWECCDGPRVGRVCVGNGPPVALGTAAGSDSAPPSLPAALSLQDTLFPDVGGTRALVSELERK